MVGINLIFFEFEVGLNLVEGNPGLTFILFIAYSLLFMLGLRFGYYAHRNLKGTAIAGQQPIWLYLRYIGGFATLYGLAGVLEIVTSLRLAAKNGFLLGMTLMIAFAIRQIHFTATTERGDSKEPFERVARAIFVAILIVFILVALVTGQTNVTATIEGVSALAFLACGVAYYHDQMTNARLRGTFLDSLLRHLLPILTFAALVSLLAIWIPLGLARVVVLHVQVVFIIMAATALMTGTVKLRQNLAGL